MNNSIVFPITLVIIFASIICRINMTRHKKNHNIFLSEIENSDLKSDSNLKLLLKYINKHYEIQEVNQYNYLLVIIVTLIILFYNI